jgi:hypothetical protein
MRPALYQTLPGLRELSFRMSQAQSYLGDDPDVRVIGAFVAWNAGDTKAHQYVAAVLSADALKSHSAVEESNGTFVLRPLAIEYLKDYLLNPIPDELTRSMLPNAISTANGVRLAIGPPAVRVREQYPTVQELYAVLEGAAGPGAPQKTSLGEIGGPMAHIIKFDQIVRALYRQEIPAYVKMVDASRKCDTFPSDSKAAFCTIRQAAARDIAAAWRTFDSALTPHNALFCAAFCGLTQLRTTGKPARTCFRVPARLLLIDFAPASSWNDDAHNGPYKCPSYRKTSDDCTV